MRLDESIDIIINEGHAIHEVRLNVTKDQLGLSDEPDMHDGTDVVRTFHFRNQIVIDHSSGKCIRVQPSLHQSVDAKDEIVVTLSSVIKHALPVPTVQTIFLEGRNIDNKQEVEQVRNVSMCLEHNVDPALCWGQNLCMTVRPATFPNMREIVRHTYPLLNLEAINSAVLNRKQDFVFTNVQVAFFRLTEPRYTFVPISKPNQASSNPFNYSLKRNKEELLALVQLPKQMCIDLRLTPQKLGMSNEEIMALHIVERSFIALDFFCIRITDEQIARNCQWVGHFVSVDVTKSKYEPFYLVLCKCTYASSSIPDDCYSTTSENNQKLMHPSIPDDCYSTTSENNQKLMHPKNVFPRANSQRHRFLRCRVEMIKMEESIRRTSKTARSLPFCNLTGPIANLIRGPGVPLSFSELDTRTWIDVGIANDFNPPNVKQNLALRTFSCNAISLLQGPPGTGKTEVIAQSVAIFVQDNQDTLEFGKPRPIFMFACMQNKQADDFLRKLIRLDLTRRFRVVRICSKSIENRYYPVNTLNPFPDDTVDDRADLHEYDLHHIIRGVNGHLCEISALFRKYDGIIAEKVRLRQKHFALEHAAAFELTTEEQMDSEDCWAMKDLIAQLEEHIVGAVADIVITTLGSASNSKRFKFLFGEKPAALVKQLVIDEASTAPELDTLGPILTFINRPTFAGDKCAPRLLLVGDHKQLGPVITSRDASIMGYGKTFFERHVGTTDCSVMLAQHYRMPEAVASWPSETFYDDMLIPATVRQLEPAHPARFFPTKHALCFVDIVGIEHVIALASSSHGSFSIKNAREIYLATNIARRLLQIDPTILPQQICILSVYRSHIEDVQSELDRQELGAVQTRTVHSSQGAEWEYVILCCVRSREHEDETAQDAISRMQYSLGLVKDNRCLNVGLTRARTGLIIIGDYDVLYGANNINVM